MEILFCMERKENTTLIELPGAVLLLEKLAEKGVRWNCYPVEKGGCFQEQVRPENLLIITDSICLVQRLKKTRQGEKICCIGYQPMEDTHFFPETSLVLSSFEDVDVDLFENTWRRFHGMSVLIAQTERLLIRESVEQDFPFLYAMSKEPERDRYTEMMPGDYTEEEAKFRAYIRWGYSYYGFGLWTIEEKSSGKVVGRCGLMPAERNVDGVQVELGYLIGKENRRKGYALEACRKILEYAFGELACTTVCAVIHEENIPSKMLAQRLGFQRRGVRGEEEKMELWTADFS